MEPSPPPAPTQHRPPLCDAATLWPDPVPVPLTRRWAIIGLFLLVLFAFDRAIGLVIDQLAVHSQYRYSKLYAAHSDAAAAIVANSRGENPFFPPEMPQRLPANVSTPSQTGGGMNGRPPSVGDHLPLTPPP